MVSKVKHIRLDRCWYRYQYWSLLTILLLILASSSSAASCLYSRLCTTTLRCATPTSSSPAPRTPAWCTSYSAAAGTAVRHTSVQCTVRYSRPTARMEREKLPGGMAAAGTALLSPVGSLNNIHHDNSLLAGLLLNNSSPNVGTCLKILRWCKTQRCLLLGRTSRYPSSNRGREAFLCVSHSGGIVCGGILYYRRYCSGHHIVGITKLH